MPSLKSRRWRRLEKVAAEHSADEKKNSLQAADDNVYECAAGAIALREGRVVIATQTRGGGRKSTPKAVDGDKKLHKPARRKPASPASNYAASGASPDAGTCATFAGCPAATKRKGRRPGGSTSTKAAIATRVRGVGKTSTAKDRDETGSQGAAERSIRKRPAAAGVSPRMPDADMSEDDLPLAVFCPRFSGEDSPLGKQEIDQVASKSCGVVQGESTSAAALRKGGRPRGQRRVDALDAKYPWGRESRPPPTDGAEQKSLADQIARLRKEAANFRRPDRPDAKRLARAEAMLRIMRGKAQAGFGGGLAMATHGFSLNRSEGLALAKRARKLELDLEAHFDPGAAPSVLVEDCLLYTSPSPRDS